jgi:hypothetical protein
MTKLISRFPGWTAVLVLILVCIAVYVIGADITQKASYSVIDGARSRAVKDLVETDVPAIISAVNNLDQLASIVIETGAATNNQVVTFTKTFAAAPKVFVSTQATNYPGYAASITTTGFTMQFVGSTTNGWTAIYVP